MHEKYLMHYGILGQKKGERRFQYKDGTYTELGKLRRRIGDGEEDSSLESLKKNRLHAEDKLKRISRDLDDGTYSEKAKLDRLKANRKLNVVLSDIDKIEFQKSIDDGRSAIDSALKSESNQNSKSEFVKKEGAKDNTSSKVEDATLDRNGKHSDYNRAHGKVPIDKMSDADLIRANKRLENEKKYKQATKEKSPIDAYQEGVKSSRQVVEGAEQSLKYMKKITGAKKAREAESALNARIATMSTEELRSLTNRLQAETNYKNALRSQNTEVGKISAMDVLDAFGGIVTVAGGLVGIAAAIKQLKGDD